MSEAPENPVPQVPLYEVPEEEMIEIKGPEDFPPFANEDEEDAFWSTHYLGEEYFARVGQIPVDERPAAILRRAAEARRAGHARPH